MKLNFKYLITIGFVSAVLVCGDYTSDVKFENNVLEETNSTSAAADVADLSSTTAASNQDFKKVSLPFLL